MIYSGVLLNYEIYILLNGKGGEKIRSSEIYVDRTIEVLPIRLFPLK